MWHQWFNRNVMKLRELFVGKKKRAKKTKIMTLFNNFFFSVSIVKTCPEQFQAKSWQDSTPMYSCLNIYCTSVIFRLWPANQLLSVWTMHKSWLHMQWSSEVIDSERESAVHSMCVSFGAEEGEGNSQRERIERSWASDSPAMKQWITLWKTLTNKIDPGRLKINWRFPETNNLFTYTQAVFVLLAGIILCRILMWHLNHTY